jgi:hypothetical protein
VCATGLDGRKSFSALRECEFSFVKCILMVEAFRAPIFGRDHYAEANDVPCTSNLQATCANAISAHISVPR